MKTKIIPQGKEFIASAFEIKECFLGKLVREQRKQTLKVPVGERTVTCPAQEESEDNVSSFSQEMLINWKGRRGVEREKEFFYLLIHFPNACNNQDWATVESPHG